VTDQPTGRPVVTERRSLSTPPATPTVPVFSPVAVVAPYTYAGVGLFIAPIFPTGLPWLHRAAPQARRAGAVVIPASMAGGVAAGPALGKAIEWSGVRAVPLILGGVSGLCLAVTLRLIRATRAHAVSFRG
jgi:predicted MFS family arabinose efflux permease